MVRRRFGEGFGEGGRECVMAEDAIGGYYDRLSRWTWLAQRLGYGRRRALSVHRALADPRAGGRSTPTRLHDLLLEHLPPLTAPRVLDAGCGFGATMVDLAQRVGGEYVGLTLSAAQASTATRAARRAGLADRVRILVRSYDNPPAGPFDLILAIESLAHSPTPGASLGGLVPLLAPGGVMAIVDDMPEPDASASPDLATFKAGWRCPALWSASRYYQELAALGAAVTIDRDLTSEFRPRTLRRIEQLERLNRALRRAVPSGAWRAVMDSHRGGLALERLYRHGLVHYRLLVARSR